MKRRVVIFGIVVMLACLAGLAALQALGAFLPEYAGDMDGFMGSRLQALGAPGMAAGIVAPDGILWEGYYGTYNGQDPVSEDTIFPIASISKTMVATAAMQLWEQGRFDLDDDINDYLDFEVRNPYHPGAAITFRHLMTHQSTIIDRDPFYVEMYTLGSGGGDSPWDLGEFLQAYLVPGGQYYDRANFLESAPGQTPRYSNYGTALLARLVERISGQGFDAYFREHILLPLGMEHTYYRPGEIPAGETELASPFSGGTALPDYSFPDYPAGGLRTTVRDLGRFVSFYLDPAAAEAGILQPGTVDLMFGDYGASTVLGSDRMGLIWMHMDWIFFEAVGHNGGDPGVSAYMLLYPDDGFAILLFTNGDFRPSDPRHLFTLRNIIERLHAEGQRLVSDG